MAKKKDLRKETLNEIKKLPNRYYKKYSVSLKDLWLRIEDASDILGKKPTTLLSYQKRGLFPDSFKDEYGITYLQAENVHNILLKQYGRML